MGRTLRLPHLEKLGLGNITAIPGVRPQDENEGMGAYGKAVELSTGKDTTSGIGKWPG
jgi:phosphopentomutase